jgi:phage regulator Rha-like protein
MNTQIDINLVELKNNELVISHKIIAEAIFEFDENSQSTYKKQLRIKIRSVQKLITENIKELEFFGQVRFEIATVENSVGAKNKETTYYLNEQQATLLITFMRNTNKIKNFKIKLVDDFFKMREILKSKNSQKSKRKEEVEVNLLGLEFVFKTLRPSQASKITMTEKLYKKLKLETNYLPKYTEEKLTRSLTYLLKKYEINLSTQKANLKLLEVGILEKMERDSSCGNKKYFYSLTEKGLEFGKNLISPKNERETQPHFFEDKFLELVKLF